ncbi:MAG: hypothetical protein WCA84_01220 [Ignavibacteriaceae bacterium]
MPKFVVSLSRTYLVEIEAKNENAAKEFTEFYLGDVTDLSTQIDKKKHGFNIIDIRPAINEAFEVEELEEDD